MHEYYAVPRTEYGRRTNGFAISEYAILTDEPRNGRSAEGFGEAVGKNPVCTVRGRVRGHYERIGEIHEVCIISLTEAVTFARCRPGPLRSGDEIVSRGMRRITRSFPDR